VLVDKDGVIIAGHGRLLAAKKLGMPQVPVIVLGYLTEKQRRALVIADNKIAMNAGWNEEILRAELDALLEDGFTLDLVGFTDDELASLAIPEETTIEGQAPEDEAPEPGAAAVTLPGDVWVMGKHRLVCGTAVQLGSVQRALAGGVADMCFTDPPYNVN